MKSILIPFMLLAASVCKAQSVGIGTTAPNTNAVLEVASPSKAMIIPRLSNGAIDSLTPADGMLVFNTSKKCFMGYSSGGNSVAVEQNFANAGTPINRMLGQSFIAPVNMKLNGISLYLEKFGTGTTITIEVYEGAHSTPYFASRSFAVTSSGVSFISFGDYYTLKQGYSYTFIITAPAGDTTNYAGIYYSTNNVYANGSMYDHVNFTNNDLFFIIHQNVATGWKALNW